MTNMLNGRATWLPIGCENYDFAKIREIKLKMTPQKLCRDYAERLLPFANEVFNYEFEEEPNYAKLKF
jgi:hypothetical protein